MGINFVNIFNSGMMNRERGWHHAYVGGDKEAALNILVRYFPANQHNQHLLKTLHLPNPTFDKN